jgi:hypothetical protein
MSLKTDLEAVIADARVDADLLRAIVQGPADGPDSIIETENGQIKTLALTLAEIEQEFLDFMAEQ